MNGNQSYRPDIDGLRAIAALSVLLFHYQLGPFGGGFVGVDVFFVISGYLITTILRRELAAGAFSLRDFLGRRIRRIVPAYLVMLLITVGVATIIFAPRDLLRLSAEGLSASTFVSNFYYWFNTGYFEPSALGRPLLHTWTLSVEWQFYLVLPLVLLTIRSRPGLFPIVIAGAGAISLILALAAANSYPEAVFYLLPFRAFEFAIGAALVWMQGPRSAIAATIASTAGIALVASSVVFVSPEWGNPALFLLMPTVGTAAAIWGGQKSVAPFLSWGPVAYLGKLSYSIYLIHWPLLSLFAYGVDREVTPIERGGLMLLCLTLATALYYWVEMPFRRPSIRNSKRLAVTFMAAVSFCGVTVVMDGLPQRLGPLTAAQAATPPVEGGEACDGRRCESNPGAPYRVYMIGDSFMRAYYSGITSVFPDVNFVVFESGGCEFYSLTFVGDNKYKPDECKETRQRAFEEIRNTPAPVLLSQRWSGNLPEAQLSTTDPSGRFMAADVDEYAAFVASQVAELSTHLKVPVTVIGGPPQFAGAGTVSGSPFDCVQRPLRTRICEKLPRRSDVASLHDRINAALERRLPGRVDFIDPFDSLCTPIECLNFTPAGDAIYADYGHLSVAGGKFVVQDLYREFVDSIAPGTMAKIL